MPGLSVCHAAPTGSTTALVENRYIVDRLDAAEWRAESDALGAIARRLEFPANFGGNLDALGDCLLDLQVPDESGRAVVFERYDALVARVGTFAWTVLDVFASKCRHHLLLGRRLIVMLQSDDPQLDLRPVGACPVAWNYQEWLNKSRRL